MRPVRRVEDKTSRGHRKCAASARRAPDSVPGDTGRSAVTPGRTRALPRLSARFHRGYGRQLERRFGVRLRQRRRHRLIRQDYARAAGHAHARPVGARPVREERFHRARRTTPAQPAGRSGEHRQEALPGQYGPGNAHADVCRAGYAATARLHGAKPARTPLQSVANLALLQDAPEMEAPQAFASLQAWLGASQPTLCADLAEASPA